MKYSNCTLNKVKVGWYAHDFMNELEFNKLMGKNTVFIIEYLKVDVSKLNLELVE